MMGHPYDGVSLLKVFLCLIPLNWVSALAESSHISLCYPLLAVVMTH